MGKIFYEFDPEELTGVKVPASRRDEALDEVADFVKESMLSDIGKGKSPVDGEGSFPALSDAYKKIKREKSSKVIPNLELNGDLLDSLDVRKKRKKLRVEVGADQDEKADGHCNFTGRSKLPRRRFMPKAADGQTFTGQIVSGIKKILESYDE